MHFFLSALNLYCTMTRSSGVASSPLAMTGTGILFLISLPNFIISNALSRGACGLPLSTTCKWLVNETPTSSLTGWSLLEKGPLTCGNHSTSGLAWRPTYSSSTIVQWLGRNGVCAYLFQEVVPIPMLHLYSTLHGTRSTWYTSTHQQDKHISLITEHVYHTLSRDGSIRDIGNNGGVCLVLTKCGIHLQHWRCTTSSPRPNVLLLRMTSHVGKGHLLYMHNIHYRFTIDRGNFFQWVRRIHPNLLWPKHTSAFSMFLHILGKASVHSCHTYGSLLPSLVSSDSDPESIMVLTDKV